MKKLAIIMAGADEIAARQFSHHARADGTYSVSIGSAYAFNGSGGEDRAYVMADVPRWHRERIQAAYADCVLVDMPKVERIAPEEVISAARMDSHLRTIKLGRPGRPRATA